MALIILLIRVVASLAYMMREDMAGNIFDNVILIVVMVFFRWRRCLPQELSWETRAGPSSSVLQKGEQWTRG